MPAARARTAVAGALAVAALVVLAVPTGATPGGRAQASPTVTSGVDYSTGSDGSLLLDVYEPAGTATALPAVVLVHGGGWTSGDRTQVAPGRHGVRGGGDGGVLDRVRRERTQPLA